MAGTGMGDGFIFVQWFAVERYRRGWLLHPDAVAVKQAYHLLMRLSKPAQYSEGNEL